MGKLENTESQQSLNPFNNTNNNAYRNSNNTANYFNKLFEKYK